MYFRFILVLIFAFSSLLANAQNHPLEELYFENLAGLFFTDKDTPVVIKDASTHKAAVIDPNTYKINNDLIRRGKGPGELARLYSFGFDKQKEEACLLGVHLRLICTKLNGKVIRDEKINWIDSYGPGTPLEFLIHNGWIIYPLSSKLSVSDPSNKIKVAGISSTENLESVQFLTLSLNDLGISYLEDLSLTNNIFIKPRILKLDEEHILIGIAGLPYFFIFKDGHFFQRIAIKTEYEVKISVSMQPGFPSPGVLTPANINNLQRVNDSTFLVSRGNTLQNIPTGIDFYEFDLNEEFVELKRIRQMELTDLPEEVTEPRITLNGHAMFMITNYHFFASQIYHISAWEGYP